MAIIKAALDHPEFGVRGQANTAAADLAWFTPELGRDIRRGRLDPKRLFDAEIVWRKQSTTRWTATALYRDCELRVSTYGYEPLYTVTVGTEKIDFDEMPTTWTIDLD